MATHTLLDNITWNMEFPPRQDAQLVVRDETRPIGLQVWKGVVFSPDNFTIIYPMAPYDEETVTINYETDGQAVSLLDLLTSIYEFYQEPLSQGDLNKLLRHHDLREGEVLEKRINALLGRTYFLGLDVVDTVDRIFRVSHE